MRYSAFCVRAFHNLKKLRNEAWGGKKCGDCQTEFHPRQNWSVPVEAGGRGTARFLFPDFIFEKDFHLILNYMSKPVS